MVYSASLYTLLSIFWLGFQSLPSICYAKYVNGHLKTLEDWEFLARFCFISGRGKYEYEIEFDRKYGEPQLLLYYDDKSQWPSVYKSGKSCRDKLSVLSVTDNQIVTLSARSPYNTLSGCTIMPKNDPKLMPAPPIFVQTTESTKNAAAEDDDGVTITTQSYFDKYLKTTTVRPNEPSIDRNSNTPDNFTEKDFSDEFGDDHFNGFNETDVFNSSAISGDERSHNGGGLLYKHDIVFENQLENSTEYKHDVEEMFESPIQVTPSNEIETNRQRRSDKWPLHRRGRETYVVRCHNAGTFISSRERWWYIAIANCGSEKGLDVTYRFKMTNGQTGDFWHEHFSADEMLIPPILLCELVSYALLLLALFFCTVELKALHLYHCTYRLFGFSVTLQLAGVFTQGIAWIRYGMTGYGPHTTVGSLLMSASEIAFLLLLLLMAKGYTITRARLSSCSIVKLTIFINTYIVAYIILFVYQAEAFDPGEVLNLYESPAGFGLSLLRCIAWCAFMISTATTIRKNPEKSSFYYPFGLFGSLWLLGGPFLTLVGIGLLDAWVRESVMCGTFAIMSFGGHSAFLWLTWPSRANKSFPYHVKTNHVGIASENDDGADYPRHTYEPTHIDQNIIIPLSRRTEELINGIYGQYIYDHQRCESNAHSHASFPEDRNAPPEILSSSQLADEAYKNDLKNRFATYLQKSTPTTTTTAGDISQPHSCTLVNDYDDNQVDSGHPSLDQSGSPSGNTTKSISDGDTPAKEIRKDSVESIESNPFVVDDVKQTPNKIILEPIEKSIQSMRLPAIVPRHLFAAKKNVEQ